MVGTITIIRIPCPGCGAIHDFKPGMIYGRHCDACRLFWAAAEWKQSFMDRIDATFGEDA